MKSSSGNTAGPKVLIIAEIGSVHDGSFGNALGLVDAAAECGADIVKFQTHIAAAETLRSAPAPSYFNSEPRYEYFERTAFSGAQWKAIKQHCESRKVEFMSSPFSVEAVTLLEGLGVKRHKIPSGEVTNLPLLEAVGKTKKPVLLSSGMSSWKELDAAVETLKASGTKSITVMQCSSEYPCENDHVGLNVIGEMLKRYKLPVGFSDHTLTNYATFAAVVLGATVIERHFTFSRKMYGSDARHSLEPAEFSDCVRGIRAIGEMLANPVNKSEADRYATMKQTFEKSVVVTRPVAKGETLSADALGLRRPGTGIPSSRISELVGKKAKRALDPEQLLSFDDIA
jgi:N,N'-diacetyllegionaminate synthase